jgi:hypothetical protein
VHRSDRCSLEKKDFEPQRKISIPTFIDVLDMRWRVDNDPKSSILRGVKDYPIYSKILDPSKRER